MTGRRRTGRRRAGPSSPPFVVVVACLVSGRARARAGCPEAGHYLFQAR